ncbi:MAG: 3-keto-disaccharide hydrolase [Planctomycetota bacterium]
MARTTQFLLMTTLVSTLACSVSAARKEVYKPDEAKADPDFAFQGEYLGTGVLYDGTEGKIGAQVIARGEGQFEIYLLAGGLPGEGWKKGDPRFRVEGQRKKEQVVISGEGISGVIARDALTLHSGSWATLTPLKRVERVSPTIGAKPPKGAVVLFDGTSADKFEDGRLTEMKTLLSGCTSKDEFGSHHMHLEFRLSWMPDARGQGRSNSGVYVDDCYEVQVLDSFGLEGKDNECGGLYGIKEPDVNMCLPPMAWQTYDVDFTAPKFDDAGKKTANARLKLSHNGVVIHDIELPRRTPGRKPEGPGPRPLHLQGHGCHVNYRNIWIQPTP